MLLKNCVLNIWISISSFFFKFFAFQGSCSDVEQNKRYNNFKVSSFEDVNGISLQKDCRQVCRSHDDCAAWNYAKSPYFRCKMYKTYSDENIIGVKGINLGAKECGACTTSVTDFRSELIKW